MRYTGLTKAEIVRQLASDKKLIQEIKSYVKYEWYDDLLQDFWIYLLEKTDEQKLLRLAEEDKIKFFVFSCVTRQLKSNKSSTHYKYRNSICYDVIPDYDSVENGFETKQRETERTDLIDSINSELNKLDWYDRQIFNLFILGDKTFTELQDELNISRNSLFNTVKKVKQHLKKKIKR